MLMLTFFSWWYGAGWAKTVSDARAQLQALSSLFSVDIMLRTLFSPWKRIITYPGAGLDAHLRAMLDNLVSRVIGFVIRLFVLVAAFVSFIALAVFVVLRTIIWPLVPLLAIGLIVWGLVA